MKIIQTRFRDINPLGIFILLGQESYDAYSKFILNLNKIRDFHKGPFKLYVAKIEKESTFKAFDGYNVICRLITDKDEVPKYAVDNIPVKNDVGFLEALSDFIYELYDADLKSLQELIKKKGIIDEEKEIFEQILHLFTHKRNSLPDRGDYENPLFSNIFEKAFNPLQPLRRSAFAKEPKSVKEYADTPEGLKDRIREDRELQRHVESIYDSIMYFRGVGIKINKLFELIDSNNDNEKDYNDLTIELKITERKGRRKYKIDFSFGEESHLSDLGTGDHIFLYVICLLFSKQDLSFRHRNLVWSEKDYDDSINTNPKLKWLKRLHALIFDDTDGNRKEFKTRILSLGRDDCGGRRPYNNIKAQCNSKITQFLQQYSISLPKVTIASDRKNGMYRIPVPAERIIIPKNFEHLANHIPDEMK